MLNYLIAVILIQELNHLKSIEMEKHFHTLIKRREAFYQNKMLDFEQAWNRPLPNKWSIGETLYHLFLMVRLFRRFSNFYIPVKLPIAYVGKHQSYKSEIHNIYEEYRDKRKDQCVHRH